MLKSVEELINQPYDEAKKELTKKITKAVTAGIHTSEKILMLGYLVEHSSENEPQTNEDLLCALGVPRKNIQRSGLTTSMGVMQRDLQGYIGRDGGSGPVKYFIHDEVLEAYEEKHVVSLRKDLLELLNKLRESHPITPGPYKIELLFPEIPAGTLW